MAMTAVVLATGAWTPLALADESQPDDEEEPEPLPGVKPWCRRCCSCPTLVERLARSRRFVAIFLDDESRARLKVSATRSVSVAVVAAEAISSDRGSSIRIVR